MEVLALNVFFLFFFVLHKDQTAEVSADLFTFFKIWGIKVMLLSTEA